MVRGIVVRTIEYHVLWRDLGLSYTSVGQSPGPLPSITYITVHVTHVPWLLKAPSRCHCSGPFASRLF